MRRWVGCEGEVQIQASSTSASGRRPEKSASPGRRQAKTSAIGAKTSMSHCTTTRVS